MADGEREEGGEGGDDAGPSVEDRAKVLGWSPKEKWRGDPEHWVDAAEFIERGERLLPILKANNRQLETDVVALRRQNQELSAGIAELRGSMGEFVEFQRSLLADKLDAQAKAIRAEIRTARDGDDEAQVEKLEEQLDEVKESKRELAKQTGDEKDGAKPPAKYVDPPELLAWKEKNPWFGGETAADARKTAMALQLGREARSKGLEGDNFFAYVDEQMEEAFPPARRSTASKSEGNRPSGGGGGGGRSKFDSLPEDAKAQARADASRFVGKNKLFQTDKEWFDHFATQYLE